MHSDRARFYAQIGALNMTPLWESLHTLVPRQPESPCVPAIWRYKAIRPFIMEAGELITAEEAVRPVWRSSASSLPFGGKMAGKERQC